MNIGIGGAIFMWALFLWPLLVGVLYPVVRRPPVSNLPAFGFACIVLGYSAMYGAVVLTNLVEERVTTVGLFVLAPPIVAPLITTYLLALAVSKRRGNDE